MSARRGLVRQAVGLSGARGAGSLISAVWLVVAARHLPLVDFGDLMLLLALGLVATTISDSGIQLLIAGHTARADGVDDRAAKDALLRRAMLALLASAGVVALYVAVANDKRIVIPLVFAVSIIATSLYSTLLSMFRALDVVALDGWNEVLSRVGVLIVGGFWLVRGGGGLLAAVAVYAIADVCSLVVIATRFLRDLRRTQGARRLDLKLRTVMPLAAALFVNIVYYRADLYLVGLLKGSADAGLYGAAYRLLDAAMLPGLALANLVVAHVSRAGDGDLRVVVHRFERLALALTLPVVVVGCLTAPFVITHAFGSEFDDASVTAVVLLLSAVPGALVSVLIPVVAVRDRRMLAQRAVVSLLLNVVLNLVLIPFWSGTGAAVANVISQVAFAAMLHRAVGVPARNDHASPATADVGLR